MKALSLASSVACVAGVLLGNTVNFGVLVLDSQTGSPVVESEVKAGFKEDRGPLSRDRYKYTFNQYFTDEKGYVNVRGVSNTGNAGATVVRADGYYCPARGGGPQFKTKNLLGVWQPENVVVTIKLQRVEHPIPLFVKSELLDVKQEIANINKGVFSYDLMKGDWLPPLGNGEVADIEFTRLPHEDLGEFVGASGVKGHAYRDAVAVRFIGDGNGLVECKPMKNAALKIRTAPENGYKADYMCWRGKNQKLEYDTNRDERRCFAFRIRTRKEEHGSIVKAYYGKIYGDFIMYTDRGPIVLGVKFSYYLNPKSLDRNLEWDRVNNLCPTPGEVGRTVGDRAP